MISVLSWENLKKRKGIALVLLFSLYFLDLGLTAFGFRIGLGGYEKTQGFFSLEHQLFYVGVLVVVLFISFSSRIRWGSLNQGVFYGAMGGLSFASIWNVIFFGVSKFYGLW